MANCNWCGQPMGGKLPARTCRANLVEIAHFSEEANASLFNFLFRPVPYDGAEGARCPTCRVLKDGDHHPGCDREKCPVCSHLLNHCGCLAEDEPGEGEDEE